MSVLNGDRVEIAEEQAADPQMVVAAAINDVIDLARAMSPAGDFSRGAVEMRRRLAVMDQALAQAEAAGVLQGGMPPVQGNA